MARKYLIDSEDKYAEGDKPSGQAVHAINDETDENIAEQFDKLELELQNKVNNTTEGANTLLNKLDESTDSLLEDDEIIVKTTNDRFIIKKFENLWNLIKEKAKDVFSLKDHRHDNAIANEKDGFISKEDKDKLDNLSNYVLPVAGYNKLGGVKTSSNVSDINDYHATPIVNGIPYYKDTITDIYDELDGSTDEYIKKALSAKQGYVLNEKIKSTDSNVSSIQEELLNKADKNHTHTVSEITDLPDWVKSENKPNYSWSEITNKPTTFTPSKHTHSISDIIDLPDWVKSDTKPTYDWSEITNKPTTFPCDCGKNWLPLTGGTLTNDTFPQLTLKRSGDAGSAGIGFENSNGIIGYIMMNGTADGGLKRWTADKTKSYRLLDEENYANIIDLTKISTFVNHTHSVEDITDLSRLAGSGLTFVNRVESNGKRTITINHTKGEKSGEFGSETSSVSLNYGDSFKVGYAQYDSNGHIILSSNSEITLPNMDSDFSSTSTLPLSNKTITDKFNSVDVVVGNLSNSLNSAYKIINKMNISAGSTIKPIYFKDGVPTALNYTIETSVPANALFTDSHIDQKVNNNNLTMPLLLGFTNSEDVNGYAWKNDKFTANPSTGVLTATTFKGNLTGTADNATTWAGYINDINTENTSNEWLLIANGLKIQHKPATDFATADHTHDYLPLTGGTLTGNLTMSESNIILPKSKATMSAFTAMASGTLNDTLNSIVNVANYRSFIGSVYLSDKSWHGIISVRHRNGYSDGSNYGFYIRELLTADGSLVWNKQTGASTGWLGERTLLDTTNYSTYVSPVNHTHKYLPLAGGTMDTDSSITIKTSIDARYISYKANTVKVVTPNGGWAIGMSYFKSDGTTQWGEIGAYGNATSLIYYYIGPTYNKPFVKIKSDGTLNTTNEIAVETTESSAGARFRVKSGVQSTEISLSCSNESKNHGVWSYTLNKWLIYGNSSNVYVDGYKLAAACSKDVTTEVTKDSAALITSGGVYNKLHEYRPMEAFTGTSGSAGYVCFAQLKVQTTYVNKPIEFKLACRGRNFCNLIFRFVSTSSTDPGIELLGFYGCSYEIYAYKSATSTWQLYYRKFENYDQINILSVYNPYPSNKITVTYPGTFVTTKHTSTTANPVVNSTTTGAINAATVLLSKNVGSNVVPVFFNSEGKPVVCKYTLGDASTKTIKTATNVTHSGWVTDGTPTTYVPDMAFISYWNGAYDVNNHSNLRYFIHGAFGTAATKGVDTTPTNDSGNLITSGAMYTALNNKLNTTSDDLVKTWWCSSDVANTAGWYHFMTVTMVQYSDFSMTLSIKNEYAAICDGILSIHIRNYESTTTTPAPNILHWLVRRGWAADAVIAVVDGLTVKFYVNQTVPQYSGVCFRALSVSTRGGGFGETKGAGQSGNVKFAPVSSTAPTTGLTASKTSADDGLVSYAKKSGTTDAWYTTRNINGMSINGSADRVNYGTCSTAAATLAKVINCTGFSLITGAEITVKFTYGSTSSTMTLNVNGTGAKSVYYRGSTVIDTLSTNSVYTFRYNGSGYDIVGDIDRNNYVQQVDTSSVNNNYRLLFSANANDTTETYLSRKASKFTVNPYTGVLTVPNIRVNSSTSGSLYSGRWSTGSGQSSIEVTIANLFTKYNAIKLYGFLGYGSNLNVVNFETVINLSSLPKDDSIVSYYFERSTIRDNFIRITRVSSTKLKIENASTSSPFSTAEMLGLYIDWIV